MNAQIDIRPALPAVRVPTLVLHRTGDRAVEIDRGRHLAEAIAGAQFVELDGVDHLPWLGDVDSIADVVAGFLTGTRTAVDEVDTVLTTIRCAAFDPHRQPDALIRREIARYRGRTVGASGHGVLATFDGPARAVRCACALRDAVRSLGLEARAGVHTCEVELCDGGVVAAEGAGGALAGDTGHETCRWGSPCSSTDLRTFSTRTAPMPWLRSTQGSEGAVGRAAFGSRTATVASNAGMSAD